MTTQHPKTPPLTPAADDGLDRRTLIQMGSVLAAHSVLAACEPPPEDRLSNPRAALGLSQETGKFHGHFHALRGYPSATSVSQGGSIQFHLLAPPPAPDPRDDIPLRTFTLSLWRAWAPSPTAVLGTFLIPGGDTPATGGQSFGWSTPLAPTTISAAWPSGLYFLVAQNAMHVPFKVCPFVVRAEQPGSTGRILFAVDFLTHHAYSEAGGRSLYSDAFQPGATTRVSLDRPFSRDFLEQIPELPAAKWLGSQPLAVEYCSTVDLHTTPDLLDSYDCLLLAGHVEYWTKQMRDQVERSIRRGRNLVVLGGNTCYWQIRLEDGEKTVVCHRKAGDDPNTDPELETVTWAGPPVNRPANEFLGVGWTHGAFGRPGGALNNLAYQLHFPGHWTLQGVAGSQTEPFMFHETDAAPFIESGGLPRVTGEEKTPLSFVVLGSANCRDWVKPGRGTMGIYTRGGTVFNGASTEWPDMLGRDGPNSIKTITANVLNRLKTSRAGAPFDTIPWEAVGTAFNIRSMTAACGRLYAVTSDGNLWFRHAVLAQVPWIQIGTAAGAVVLAASGDTLYGLTAGNQLQWRPATEVSASWTAIGNGPGAVRGMAGAGGILYTVLADAAGTLRKRLATRSADVFALPTIGHEGATNATINHMASYAGALYASTTGGLLVRTSSEYFGAWNQIHTCSGCVGLAAVDHMLFAAANDNKLWWLDLTLARTP